jgi:hypothetical protein
MWGRGPALCKQNYKKKKKIETFGVHMKGVLPWFVRWARHAGTRDFCHALATLVGPKPNIVFLTGHYFT